MRPSPIRAENQRITKLSPASRRATAATAIASPITIASSWPRMPRSMIARSSNGLTTVITASTEVASRKMMRWSRYGRA